MANKIEEYVEKLDDDEKIKIINGYEVLSSTCVIGDEPIRTHAEALMKEELSFSASHVSMWMSQVAFECYRYFAWKEISMRLIAQAEMNYYKNKKETLTPIPPGYTLDQTPEA